jgi:hypothetical protein
VTYISMRLRYLQVRWKAKVSWDAVGALRDLCNQCLFDQQWINIKFKVKTSYTGKQRLMVRGRKGKKQIHRNNGILCYENCFGRFSLIQLIYSSQITIFFQRNIILQKSLYQTNLYREYRDNFDWWKCKTFLQTKITINKLHLENCVLYDFSVIFLGIMSYKKEKSKKQICLNLD